MSSPSRERPPHADDALRHRPQLSREHATDEATGLTPRPSLRGVCSIALLLLLYVIGLVGLGTTRAVRRIHPGYTLRTPEQR